MANLFAVPKYVKAASPNGLRRMMYQVQLKDRMQYNFNSIQYVNGYWYAWYFYEPKTHVDKTEAAKELTSGE